MGRLAHLAAVLILPAGALAAAQAVAHACTIDGQPTAVANGRRAVSSQNPPTVASMRLWAPFSFPGSYRARTVIPLTEDRTQLRAVLPPEALKRTWRWAFGDGTHTTGWSVVHRYSRPGRYRIVVSAYYPTWHSYFAFDAVSILITR